MKQDEKMQAGNREVMIDEPKRYEKPSCETYQPMKIMRAYQDRSSELYF